MRHAGRRALDRLALVGIVAALLAPTPGALSPRTHVVTVERPATDTGAAPGGEAGVDETTPGAPPTPRVAPDEAASPEGPTDEYLDATAHASDAIAFTPGARVTVPFRPAPDDEMPVDGSAPRPLPAGEDPGIEVTAAPDGSTSVGSGPRTDATDTTVPVDAPALRTVDLIDATNASLVATPGGTAPVDGAAVGHGLRREVFGFLPYWQLGARTTVIDHATLSTIAYFSVAADGAGNLVKRDPSGGISVGWAGWTSSKMTSVINAAHKAHTRVVLTVSSFAWSAAGAAAQAKLLGSATARANLARQIASAVRARGADGVNLDFEPIVTGRSAQFTALVRSVRKALSAIARGYQVTFDTTGRIGNYPIDDATAPGGADAIFIMAYDYRSASSPSAGSISPLDGPDWGITDTIRAYTSRVSPSKLILGVPWYGRAWSTSSSALHAANISGAKYGDSTTAPYATAADLVAKYGRRYDSKDSTPWTAYPRQTCTPRYGCVTTWRQLYFDDAASLRLRYDLINRAGLRGAGIWALGYDGLRPELRRALDAAFVNHDHVAPTVRAPSASIRGGALPAGASAALTLRWSGSDRGSGIASYDLAVSVDGGRFRLFRLGLAATSVDVDLPVGHAYRFEVRATDHAGNRSPWKRGTTLRPRLVEDGSTAIRRSAGWAIVSSSAYSGRSARTSAMSASARYTVYGRGAALIASVGPSRGAVRVYVDGSLVATVDTYAATPRDRVAVWRAAWRSVGHHTIRIVVASTPGRSVVFDAVETLR